MARLLFVFLYALALASPLHAQTATPQAQTPRADDPLAAMLSRLETALQKADREAYASLFAPEVPSEQVDDFAKGLFIPTATRTAVFERDRAPLEGVPEGEGYRLVVEFFIETAGRARILTASLNMRRTASGAAELWHIVGGEGLTSVEGLYRLRVNPARQLAARDLAISTEDFRLTLAEGTVFPVEGEDGVTGLVLIGRGEMRFSPTPATEKGQLRIFSGSDALVAPFEIALVRINPFDYKRSISGDLLPVAVDPRLLRRAQEFFTREGPKSFSLDLQDLSRDMWYLLPPVNDFLAEVQTRRWGLLTFARTGVQAEDITLFSRPRRRTISLYSSTAKLALRGRFYTDEELMEYDVLDYNIEAQVVPERQYITGRARLLIRIRTGGTNTLTLRLAEPLAVTNIVSLEYGRLLHLRVRNQNSIVINLPTTLTRNSDITLVISYTGRLPSQEVDREALRVSSQQEDFPLMQYEPSYLLSSRSYWYPQNTVTEYATATLRITVPPGYAAVGSGEPIGAAQEVTLRDLVNVPSGKAFVFRATEPLRYLAFVVSRLTRVAETSVGVPPEGEGRPHRDPPRDRMTLGIEANPRLLAKGRDMLGAAEEIMRFYTSIVGDAPYASATVALVESDLPGGHSPGYFALVNSPMPTTALTWRNDPAAFTGFPDFFLAHELAHQWWGQAVGWKNYHEQWISEGFAQYFAALYAQKTRGDETFFNMLRQFRRWSLNESEEGPVHLGYRLGHIKEDSRIFRALVYNKGAAVLHMLRRLLGDEVFFQALRRFYDQMKFRKAGTDDLRRVFEQESGRPLERYFERWIYNSELPVLRYSSGVEGTDVVVRFEQLTNELFDVPVTVTVTYVNGKTQEVVVPVTEKQVEHRFRAEAPVRQIQVNRDQAALAQFEQS